MIIKYCIVDLFCKLLIETGTQKDYIKVHIWNTILVLKPKINKWK